jgi:hypothetical protein
MGGKKVLMHISDVNSLCSNYIAQKCENNFPHGKYVKKFKDKKTLRIYTDRCFSCAVVRHCYIRNLHHLRQQQCMLNLHDQFRNFMNPLLRFNPKLKIGTKICPKVVKQTHLLLIFCQQQACMCNVWTSRACFLNKYLFTTCSITW